MPMRWDWKKTCHSNPGWKLQIMHSHSLWITARNCTKLLSRVNLMLVILWPCAVSGSTLAFFVGVAPELVGCSLIWGRGASQWKDRVRLKLPLPCSNSFGQAIYNGIRWFGHHDLVWYLVYYIGRGVPGGSGILSSSGDQCDVAIALAVAIETAGQGGEDDHRW